MKKVLISAIATCLASSTLYADNPEQRQYFVDHKEVAPGQSLSVDYQFPGTDYSIQCHQDNPASELGSMAWEYKGQTYIGQIGEMRSVTLASGPSAAGLWVDQSADPKGQLQFKNLDDDAALFVTCSYQVIGTKEAPQ